MNRFIAFVLLLTLISLTACGGGDSNAATDTTCVVGTSTLDNCTLD